MRFQDADDLLKPGYLGFEPGYLALEHGVFSLAGITTSARRINPFSRLREKVASGRMRAGDRALRPLPHPNPLP